MDLEKINKELQDNIEKLIDENEKLRIENFKLKTKLQYSEDLYDSLINKTLERVND